MRFSLLILTCLAVAPLALADGISWSGRRGTLQKPDFNNQVGTYRVTSTGGIAATFKLSHVATSPNKFTYSKWEIDRWGDPAGVLTPPGSWQVVSNAANDVGFALWGYWGNFGGPLANGDTTSYQLTIDFDQPVRSLVVPLRGINALVDAQGNNAIDSIAVASFLDGAAQASPSYSSVGSGVIRSGDTLKGDFANPIGTDTGRTNTSNQGSATLTFAGTIDRVVLTIVSEARHPTPASLQDAPQNWSLSLGDLAFDPAPATGRSQITWLPRKGTLTKPGYDKSPATYQASSQDGAVTVAFDLAHVATTGDKFSYSKWEIDRWGDPDGLAAPQGSWQVVSNAANDVVLGLWGYWGTDGSAGSPPLVIGDQTSYRLTLTFNKAVSDLRFSLHGINAIFGGGLNSFDKVTVDSFLGAVAQAAPVFSNRGPGMTQSGNVLTGDFAHQIGGGFPNVTDEGSVSLRFPSAVDKVVLTLVNEARHPTPAQFQAGVQNWSFSVGDLSFLPGAQGQIVWPPRQGQLNKPGYTSASATYQAASSDGNVTATFQLDHLGTTANKFSYSKWEINRWGDPNGVLLPTGSWQVVSNSLNDVVFAIWGYWGTDNAPSSPPVAIGDQTSYRLTVSFNRPVDNLSFFLNGLNALLKPDSGFNSQDVLTVESFLGAAAQGAPTYSQEGNGFTRSGNVFTGNFANQIGGGFSGQHVTDQGSVKVQFTQSVDRVRLTLVNRADHPTPALFQTGQQTYSFSVGNLTFRYGNPSGGGQPLLTNGMENSPSQPLTVLLGKDGAPVVRVFDANDAEPDLTRLEISTDLRVWRPWSRAGTKVREIQRGYEVEFPASAQGFFRWRR